MRPGAAVLALHIFCVVVQLAIASGQDLTAIGSGARQVEAGLGKSAATGNPDLQAIGSWSRQV